MRHQRPGVAAGTSNQSGTGNVAPYVGVSARQALRPDEPYNHPISDKRGGFAAIPTQAPHVVPVSAQPPKVACVRGSIALASGELE